MDIAAIRIKTKIETKDANSQLLTLQNSIVKLAEKTDKTLDELEELGKLKIPTEQYKEVETEIKKMRAEMSRLQEKIETGSTEKNIERWKAKVEELSKSIEYAKGELADMEEAGTAFIDPTTTDAYKKKAQELEACNREMEILNKKHEELAEKQDEVNEGSGKLLKRITGLASRVFVFSQITKAFNTMLSAMKEGLQDMSQYSDEYNANMSQFSSRTTELKYNLAAMAEPVLNLLIPAFTTLTGWINTAVEAVTKFLSALSGKNTYTKAKKQVIDYAKGVAKAGEETKGALADFDDLNVLNQNSGSGSANGTLGGANAFEEVEIESEYIENLNKIKDLLAQILPYVIFIGAALLLWKIGEFLGSLLQTSSALETIFGLVGLIILVAYAVGEYFDMWENGVEWDSLIMFIIAVSGAVCALYLLFGPVAAGIALIVAGIAGVILALKDMNENGMNAQNVFLLIISVVGILIGVFIIFGAKTMIVVGIIGLIVAMIITAIKYFDASGEALGHLKDAFGELGEFVKCIFAGDMDGAFEHLKEAGKDFGNFFVSIAESIANAFVSMVNFCIDALNTLHIDLPEEVAAIVGWDHIGFKNIQHWEKTFSFQRLANGGITTGSTIANIGEAGREAVLPLENNLDYLDAFADKIASKIPSSNNGPVYLQIDGKTFARLINPYSEAEKVRIGVSLV